MRQCLLLVHSREAQRQGHGQGDRGGTWKGEGRPDRPFYQIGTFVFSTLTSHFPLALEKHKESSEKHIENTSVLKKVGREVGQAEEKENKPDHLHVSMNK